MHPLIGADDVAARLDDPTQAVVDVRWYLTDHDLGARRYAEAHIPGAAYLDVEQDLSDLSVPDAGRHPLPDREAFADLLGAKGIGNQSSVAVYDDAGGSVAARLWWMLRWLGHEDVAVIDGGFPAWISAGLPVESIRPPVEPTEFVVGEPLTGTVDRDWVAARSGRLFDARARERHRGLVEPVDPLPGHIPGAENVPATSVVDSTGRFLPPDGLADLLGDTDGSAAACGSGVNACVLILAAVAAGLPEPALYPGSYSEWSRAGMPVETG